MTRKVNNNMDLVEQLDRIFHPRAIAVIGASANPDKVGTMCLRNLLKAGFGGKIYPVNPNLSELFGLRAYPSVSAIPGVIDLAIIVIPAQLTTPTIEECAAKGVKGAILITGGFKEVGTEIGSALQDKIRDIANRNGMKIIGPNTLGFINPGANLNATFQPTVNSSKVGNVALAAQSGGICIFIIHALNNHNMGISKATGMGNRCNLDFDEVVTYFAKDEATKVIVLYIEGLEQPQRLMNVARQVVKRKPIVVYKSGRDETINRAALSHTGTLAGKYEFYKAAFTQAGMIAVDDMTELIDVTKALAFQPPSSGNRVAIITTQAGAGIIAADKCRDLDLRPAEFSPATKQRLRQLVSPLTPIDNPVDIAWQATDFDACREILRVTMEDDGVDIITVITVYAPMIMEMMRAVIDISPSCKKPITVCLDSPNGAASAGINALEERSIPTYPFPERAITGLAGLARYGKILKIIG
ncbi:acetate--CoA ligase family protein [Chloroflexota bacterium]